MVAADIEADALARLTDELGGDVSPVVTDVADESSVQALAAATYDLHGACHLLVNNAGVFQGGTTWERSAADWQWVLGVNLWGLIHGVAAFVPRMLSAGQQGHVVNTASMAGLAAAPFSGPYQTSKFAAVGYSLSLAQDLAATEGAIGASVLVPGPVDTGIGYSERNRPDDLGGERGEDVEFVDAALRDMAENHGDAPTAVADLVLDAVAADRFLIPTRPEFAEQLETHVSALLDRRLPPIPDFF